MRVLFGMVKIVELEQDSTSWKSSAGVGLAGSELPRKRPKKKKSNADLTGLAAVSYTHLTLPTKA